MSVRHPQYGLGTVKTIFETTADILFTDGKRTVAPEAAGLEPAEAHASVSGLNVPLKQFVDETLEVALRKLGLEKPDAVVTQLGLRGLKLGPIYQNFDPADPKHLPLFKEAEKLGIPINWHQGTSFVRNGPLKYSNPLLLEDIAVACPELRMIISHMGHPWETECVVRIRKHPHLYADTSALHYRPLRHYQAFMTALEYGVEHKLIFGSDFPSATPEQAIAVFELVDDLRETIWSIYQTHLQDLTRQQRQSPVIGRFEIDDDDLPF